MTHNQALLNISLIKGIGAHTIHSLGKVIKHEWASLYNASLSELTQKYDLAQSKAALIYNGLHKEKHLLKEEIELAKKYNVYIVSYIDNLYPRLLKETENHPPILYIKCKDKNTISDLSTKQLLTCVASRSATSYTHEVCTTLFKNYPHKKKLCIVSGGAIGGDTLIHKSSLESGIQTCSIIGSGLAHVYPSQNKHLFEKIVDTGGMIISPFSMETTARPGTFPARNSVLAAISYGTLVIQANIKSGALITAHYALEHGRELGAVPGHINYPLSRGTHKLIKENAHIVQAPEDINALLENNVNTFSQISCNDHVEKPNNHIEAKTNNAKTSPEDEILYLCSTPQTLHAISTKINLSMKETQSCIFHLISQSKLQQDIMGRFKKI